MKLLVRATVAFALVVLFLGALVWMAGAAYDNAGEDTFTVRNESIIADIGNWTEVDAPDYALSFEDDEVIYNSSDTQLVEDTDYEWNTTNGSVKWFDTDNVSDGEEMKITYNYTAKIQTARDIKDATTLVFFPLAFVVFLALAMVALAISAAAWRLSGGGPNGGIGR